MKKLINISIFFKIYNTVLVNYSINWKSIKILIRVYRFLNWRNN